MMKKYLALLLAGCVMLSGGFAYGDARTSNISQVEDLNKVIWEMGKKAEATRNMELWGGKYDKKSFEEAIRKSVWMDCAHRWSYQYWDSKSKLVFTLELKEGMRLLAALLDEKRVAKLQGPERLALKQMQKILDKCSMPGATRTEKALMLMDDLRYNSKVSGKQGDKRRKGSFAAFVLRKKGDAGTLAEYLQVMLMAMDVPCHTCDSYWNARNMVQLDDGNWYFLSVNNVEFSVQKTSRETEQLPDWPEVPSTCEIKIPVYTSAEKFWKAAEKAYSEGARCLGAKVKKYPGARKFKEAHEKHLAEGGSVTPSEMYLPFEEGKTRYVCVSFEPKEETPEEEPSVDVFNVKPKLDEARKKFIKIYKN